MLCVCIVYHYLDTNFTNKKKYSAFVSSCAFSCIVLGNFQPFFFAVFTENQIPWLWILLTSFEQRNNQCFSFFSLSSLLWLSPKWNKKKHEIFAVVVVPHLFALVHRKRNMWLNLLTTSPSTLSSVSAQQTAQTSFNLFFLLLYFRNLHIVHMVFSLWNATTTRFNEILSIWSVCK